MTSKQAIALARKHATGNSSAELCLRDAVFADAMGDTKTVIARCYRSLQHSVGIFHSDARKLKAHIA